MADLINIGFGNLVNAEKMIAVVNPDAAPVKRMVQNAKEQQHVIDATQGRRTKAVIVMETEQIVLSAVQPDTILRRLTISVQARAKKDREALTPGTELFQDPGAEDGIPKESPGPADGT